jgi:hypothetical protein
MVFLANDLHKQEFASLLVDFLLNIMRTCLCSCASLGASAWLLVHLTTLAFCLLSTHFLTTLRTYLVLPHPMVAHLSWCQCGHAIKDLGTHLLWCPCGGAYSNPWYISKYYHNYCLGKWNTCLKGGFLPFPSWHPMSKLISLSPKIIFGPWWTLSLLTRLAQIWCSEHWWPPHM